ncbi:MAG TPA: TetR/AcrR family transcriptional regulator [Candidatus Eisenbacteria bacterium]|nr:TetR/AcrR family transcriptional regulator [Candidatus Eisenbacteria bacterium]
MVRPKSPSRRVNRRKHIVQAAERVLLKEGLSGVTTRQISREAGCSEGALYVHFRGRLELLLAVLEESLAEMLGPLQALHDRVGRGSPHSNLRVALAGIFRFHQRAMPFSAGLFAEPVLHAAYRQSLARQGKGPHLSIKALELYISAEQRIGRVDPEVNPGTAAYLLMSSSFFRAFSEQFFGRTMRPSWNTFARRLLVAVVPLTKHVRS